MPESDEPTAMRRQACQQKVIEYLTWLSSQVEESNKLDLTDVNKISEDFYCDLLNLVYGYQLVNINIDERNAAAIDLGDQVNRVAIQVTSTRSLAKTKTTVEKFVEHKLGEAYDRLVILNIVRKSQHRDEFIVSGDFRLNTATDIWDKSNLIADINRLDIERLEAVVGFLSRELAVAGPSTIAKEVCTILELIECISDEDRPEVGARFSEDPDPDGKIRKRFADNAEYLTERYYELYLEYGAVLRSVLDGADFGQVRLRRVANYMKEHSDRTLTQCLGDPQLAMRHVVDDLGSLLAARGRDFDRGAIEFYVVWELTRCNVFPNAVTPAV
jgi:hypothetical protein